MNSAPWGPDGRHPEGREGRQGKTRPLPAPPTKLTNLPPLPRQETCETESPRHTTVLTALVATPSGIPQKPLAFPVYPREASPPVLGGTLQGPHLTRGEVHRGHCLEGGDGDTPIQQRQERRRGLGLRQPLPPLSLILSRCCERCYWQLWRGEEGVCLDFGSKTRHFTSYIQCLPGEGAPDDKVLYKSLNTESQVTKHCVTEVGVRSQLGILTYAPQC